MCVWQRVSNAKPCSICSGLLTSVRPISRSSAVGVAIFKGLLWIENRRMKIECF